jgi:F0F1-type ATP synthase assembly protein I
MSRRGRRTVTLVLLITPAVIAPLVLAGVFLGYYLGDLWGYSRALLAIVFSTVGFLAAVLILREIIVELVTRAQR